MSEHKVYALTHKISISENLTELMNKSQRFIYNVTILLLVVKRTVMLKIGKSQKKNTFGGFFLFMGGVGVFTKSHCTILNHEIDQCKVVEKS